MSQIQYFISEAIGFYEDNKFQQTLEFAKKALEIDATSPEANLYAALACIMLKKKEKALQYFELCHEKVKTMPQTMGRYAVALTENNKFEEAIAVYKAIIKNYPEYKIVNYNYGRCLMLSGKYREAIPKFDAVEAYGYREKGVYHDRGECLYHLKKYDAAEIDLLKVIKMQPSYTHASLLLGDIYMKRGLWKNAIEHFSRALYFKPENPTALTQRLRARVQIKDKEGNIENRDGAQADADKIMELKIPFVEAKTKEGNLLEIIKINISPKGELNCIVDTNKMK